MSTVAYFVVILRMMIFTRNDIILSILVLWRSSVPPEGLTDLFFAQIYLDNFPRPTNFLQSHPSSSSFPFSGSRWTSLSWTRVTVRVRAIDRVSSMSSKSQEFAHYSRRSRSSRRKVLSRVLHPPSNPTSSQIPTLCHQSYIIHLSTAHRNNFMFRISSYCYLFQF